MLKWLILPIITSSIALVGDPVSYQEEVKTEVNLQSSYLGCGCINVQVNGCKAVLETDLGGLLSITGSLISFEINAGL